MQDLNFGFEWSFPFKIDWMDPCEEINGTSLHEKPLWKELLHSCKSVQLQLLQDRDVTHDRTASCIHLCENSENSYCNI